MRQAPLCACVQLHTSAWHCVAHAATSLSVVVVCTHAVNSDGIAAGSCSLASRGASADTAAEAQRCRKASVKASFAQCWQGRQGQQGEKTGLVSVGLNALFCDVHNLM